MKHILFVDDDQEFLRVIQKRFSVLNNNALNEKKFEMLSAENVSEALMILQDREVDVVVTDVEMPVVSGIQFLSLIHGKYPDLRKVALTGFADEANRKDCADAGASLFLEKPRSSTDIYSLYASISEMLDSGSSDSGFTGFMPKVQLLDVVQMMTYAGNSVMLEIFSPDGIAEITVENGQVVHAALGDLTGVQAFYAVMKHGKGDFLVKKFIKPAENTIETRTMELIMQAAQLKDEATRKGVEKKNKGN